MAFVETGCKAAAYRQAYNASNMGEASINEEAKRLAANPLVSLRIQELRQIELERFHLTIEDISRMLLEDRELARKLETPSAAVSASTALAKLFGHNAAERHEHAGYGGGPIGMVAQIKLVGVAPAEPKVIEAKANAVPKAVSKQ